MKKLQPIIILLLLIGSVSQGYSQSNNDSDRKEKKRKTRYGTHNDFQIDLGINNYFEDGKSPSNNNALYTVKPFGSWYIALKSINDTHVTGPLHLLWGADVSWYNFKFENEATRVEEGPDGVVFMEAAGGIDYTKSKLTAAYLNASIVPMLRFGQRKRHDKWFGWHHGNFNIGCDDRGGFRIGAGAYAGYKIGSHTKYVFEEDNDRKKDRDKDGFFLNNFRYGVRIQGGFRGIDVFFNYDMNELFAKNKGPELNVFSFGVVL